MEANTLDIHLNKGKHICVGLMWDEVQGQEIDMDLQCVLLNEIGQVEDAVFYNQLQSTIAKVQHSGDSLGEKEGFDEELVVDLSSIPYQVKYIAVLVCSYKGQPLKSIETSHLKIFQSETGELDSTVKIVKPIYEMSLGAIKTKGLSFLSVILEKSFEGNWKMVEINEVGQGKTFAESEDLIKKGLVKGVGFDEVVFQECKNWKGGKSFKLEKNHSLLIPPSLTQIAVGLGWDSRCDIDASALLFDSQGNCVENIYFGNKKSYNASVVHSGDNLTGDGDGDDEVININLSQVDAKILTIWTVINIYSGGVHFNQVSGAYCRLVSGKQDANTKGNGNEFCRYNLSNNKDSISTGNIMCSITRCKGGSWSISPKGYYTKLTRQSSQMVPIIKEVMENNLQQIIRNQEVEIQIQSAVGLTSVNGNNKSNPYMVVYLNDSELIKTPTQKNTINPNWNLTLKNSQNGPIYLRFKIRSSATFFDDELGECFLDLFLQSNQISTQIHELPVCDSKKQKSSKYTGTLLVKVSVNQV